MVTYIIRRLLLMLPTLLGITLVVFTVMAASPGGISAQSLIEGQSLEPQAKRALEDYYNRLYGLDDPAPVQYLRWLNNVSPMGFIYHENGELDGFSFTKGSNLGRSFRVGRPVGDLLAERIPVTLLLNALSIPLIYVVAIGIGVRAATNSGSRFDVTSNVVLLGLWSVPTMLAGILMTGFLANEQYWRWFPTTGLSSREALDMPFMPHWGSLGEVALFALSLFFFILLFLALAGLRDKKFRTFSAGLSAVFFVAACWLSGGSAALSGSIVLSVTAFAIFCFVGHHGWRSALSIVSAMISCFFICRFWLDAEFVRGFLFDRLWHLALPVICLAYGGVAFLARLARSSVLENLHADYARTAHAKGLSPADVLWRHVMRNSLLPLITVSASLLPSLLAGSVIVESIFSIDGMGKLAVEAVQGRDRELVLSITLFSGILTLLGYLIADICYAVADPRVNYE